jgi:hypothetical protein
MKFLSNQSARLHHLQAEIGTAPPPPDRWDRHGKAWRQALRLRWWFVLRGVASGVDLSFAAWPAGVGLSFAAWPAGWVSPW